MAFTIQTLGQQVAAGEDSTRQFKSRIDNIDSLAAEMAAFANANGGAIFIGVSDNGEIHGLTPEETRKTNLLISNAASQHVRSPLLPLTENVLLENGNIIIVLTVPQGLDKPYFDKNGVIWLKTGADKRRINSKEELRRFFQYSSQFHADELPSKAGIDKLDKLLFRDFLKKQYGGVFPDAHAEQLRLLQNLNIAAGDGNLNLAGVLLFAEQPELVFPQFVAKGIRFPGIAIHADRYDDTEDFEGPLSRLFKDALAFVMRNLHKVQGGNGVNSPGTPEIPEQVFEELLVNALVHRDYLVSAPIRIFIFDDRVEIISPGTLPNNLTIANIKTGNSNIRNPILISYAAKGLLPYHGIGSGILRVLEAWPDTDFEEDREKSLFKATVYRNHGILSQSSSGNSSEKIPHYGSESSEISSVKHETSSVKIVEMMRANPHITTHTLARELGISTRAVEKHIANLRNSGIIRREGSARNGSWEILT